MEETNQNTQGQQEPQAPQLKRIDFQANKFVANGKTYFNQTGYFSLKRRALFDKMSVEVLFDCTFSEIYKSYNKIYVYLTSGNELVKSHSSALIEAFNRLNSIKSSADKGFTLPKPYVRLCTLFINAEGEDIKDWSEELANQKMADWEAEGIVDDDFFLLFMDSVPELKKTETST